MGELREEFQALNADFDGHLSVQELRDGFSSKGDVGLERLRSLENMQPSIDLTTFVAANFFFGQNQKVPETMYQEFFKFLDSNKDDKVSPKELRQVIKFIGEDSGVDSLLKNMDSDGDGMI